MSCRGPYSVKQAAEVLGVHPDTVRDWCNRPHGLASYRTAGGHRRITAMALDAFVGDKLAHPQPRRAA